MILSRLPVRGAACCLPLGSMARPESTNRVIGPDRKSVSNRLPAHHLGGSFCRFSPEFTFSLEQRSMRKVCARVSTFCTDNVILAHGLLARANALRREEVGDGVGTGLVREKRKRMLPRNIRYVFHKEGLTNSTVLCDVVPSLPQLLVSSPSFPRAPVFVCGVWCC